MAFKIIKQNWKIFLLLACLVVLVYTNSLPNQFVSDDTRSYLNNDNLGRINFSSGLAQNLNDTLIFHAFGRHPLPFRTVNILFHLGNVWLIFVILKILIKKRTVSILTAALFAVHPILIESVTWISGGPYAKYSFFLLFSLLLYISSKNWKKIIISLTLFIFALSFSEKALIFPGILFIYELSYGSLKNSWKKFIPFFFISFAWFAAIFFRFGARVESLEKNFYSPPSDNNPLYQIPIALTKYFELIFWPEKLSLYQTEMFFTPLNFWIRTALTILFLLLIIFLFFKRKKFSQEFFWLSFFVIGLLPTLAPLGIAWIVAERYVYFSALGIFALIAVYIDKINNIYNTKKVFYLLSALIIITLGIRTIDRNMDWRNQDTLWIATAQVAPSGHVIHNNLGDLYGRQGDKQRAIQEFLIAIQINPRYADAMHNLAGAYLEINQIEPAISWYKKAIANNPYLWQSYQNLAAVYLNLNQPELAQELLKKGLEANPGNPALIQMSKLIENQINAP